MLEHQGSGVGIHQRLAEKMGQLIGTGPVNLNAPKIPDGLTPELIKQALRETYGEAGLGHFWEVCEYWLLTP